MKIPNSVAQEKNASVSTIEIIASHARTDDSWRRRQKARATSLVSTIVERSFKWNTRF